MGNLFRCELLKLKRSNLLFLIVGGGLFIPIIMTLGKLIANDGARTWNDYFENTEVFSFLYLGIILFSLSSSLVCSKEFQEKTANLLFTYPYSRHNLFVGKLLAASWIIFLTYLIQFVATLATGIWLMEDRLTGSTLLLHLKIYGCSFFFQVCLVPIFTLLGFYFKNVVVPIVFSTMLTISNLFFLASDWKQYFPFLGPVLPTYAFDQLIPVEKNPISLLPVGIISLGLFLLFILLNILYLTKADVQK